MSMKVFSGLGESRGAAAEKALVADGRDPRSVTSVALGSVAPPRQPSPDTVDVKQDRAVYSRPSVDAPFYTLFDDFSFSATPRYNFYVADEGTNVSIEKGNLSFDDLPRYVKLRWVAAPMAYSVADVDVSARNGGPRPSSFVHLFTNEFPDFPEIKGALADGYLGPVTIRANVDILPPVTSVPPPSIDEQEFLASAATVGMSFHELQDAVSPTDESLRAAAAAAATSSPDSSFRGSFTLSSSPIGSTMTLKAMRASSPAVTLDATVAESARGSFVGNTENLPAASVVRQSSKEVVQVNFVDQAIVGTVSEQRVDSVRSPEHAENVIALAGILRGLQGVSSVIDALSTAGDPPTVQTPNVPEGVSYVGYVVQKYVRLSNGNFSLVEEIDVTDPRITEFIDTHVAYGRVYRYRIRAIVRWTRPDNVGITGVTADVREGTTHSNVTSFFAGGWSKTWATAVVIDAVPPPPPDELTVSPDSRAGNVRVTWKVPEDSQRDIAGFRLLRKEQSLSGQDLGPWSTIVTGFPPTNGIYFDSGIRYLQDNGHRRYVYAMQTYTRHEEISALSDQVAVSIDRSYSRSGERPVVFVSEQGVFPDQTGQFATKPIVTRKREVTAKSSISLRPRTGRTKAQIQGSTYVIRVESLATGEVRDIVVGTSYTDLGISVREFPPGPSSKGQLFSETRLAHVGNTSAPGSLKIGDVDIR